MLEIQEQVVHVKRLGRGIHVLLNCRFAHLAGVTLGEQELEEQLDACLEAVELDYLLTRYVHTVPSQPNLFCI